MRPELAQFIAALPEPSFLLTGDGEILSANRAASDLVAVPPAQLSGKSISTLVTNSEKVADYLRMWSRSRQALPGALTWLRAGGQPVETRCEGVVIQPRTESEPAGLFLRCRPKAEATDQFTLLNRQIEALSKEVMERRKAERQRDELLGSERAARLEAERNLRMKDEFLATLSHELRTPLNAILGWSQLLRQSGAAEGDTAEGLEVIERNAHAQKQLVEDLLDMNRIISGKVRLEVQHVDLAQVIEAASETVRPAAAGKNIRFQLTIDPLAGPVRGDPGRLQQVVWNLLSNAVKFTPKGGRVQVVLERVNSHVELVVSDTGEGIKPEFLPYVFDRFRQADASTSRRHGGLGLGLSIVKQLAELHGGSVRAKSPGEGKGATFVVTLPVMVLHEEEQRTAQRVHPTARSGSSGFEGAQMPSLRGVRILVVDDEPDARELVRRLLSSCDAEVATVGSAAEALVALNEQVAHVLVSDIGMPQVDGYELMRQVRALPKAAGGRVPAVALTAFARSEDRTRAMLAGYNVHLSKPLDASELIATIASLVGRTGTT